MFDHKSPDFSSTPVSLERPRYRYFPRGIRASPIVSIVTPFYNTGKVFEETAKSVFAQSFQQWEWIIVDDGSTKKSSLQMLDRYRRRDSRVRIIKQKNGGPSRARNTGFGKARSEFVVNLDSDDLLEPTAIEKWLWYIATHPAASFVNSYSIGFGAEEYVWTRGFHEGSVFLRENLVNPTSLIKASLFHAVDGYDENMAAGLEDWDFWLRLANKGAWGSTIPEIGYWYRRREDHSERWSAWSEKGKKSFLREARLKYPRLFKTGISPKPASLSTERREKNLKNLLLNSNRLKKKSRRLLLVLPWLELGGADQFNVNLATQLRERGWEITIVVTHPDQHPWLAEFARITPDIFILDRFLEISGIPSFLEYLVVSRDFDAVLITHSHMGYVLLPWLRARFPKLPIADYNHVVEMGWLAGGYPRMSARCTSLLDFHIIASNQVGNWMVKAGARRKATETCYIDVSTKQFFVNKKRRLATRERLGIAQDLLVVLFAGRYTAQKRPLLLLEIVRLAAQSTRKFRLLCAGSGELEAEMRSFVGKHNLQSLVTFMGAQSNSQIAELMNAADIFLLPSLYEGIALVLFEAMASGLAVLASDVGGQRELVTPDSGRLIPLDERGADATIYAETLVQWLGNLPSLRRMRKAARARAEAFDLKHLGPRMDVLLKKAIANASRRRGKIARQAELRRLEEEAVGTCKKYWEYIWKQNWPKLHEPPKRRWLREIADWKRNPWILERHAQIWLPQIKSWAVQQPGSIYRRYRRSMAAGRNRFRSNKRQWEIHTQREIHFWREVILNNGKQPQAYHDDIRGRAEPGRPFRRDIGEYLSKSNIQKARVLDLASGPISSLGWKLGTKKVHITAVDTLADGFNSLLAEAEISPPVKTLSGNAETIDELFPAGSFDLVFISNALDHCHDPIAVLKAAFKVLKPGGNLVIEGYIKQGEAKGYKGVYQWDIDYRDGALIVASPADTMNVADTLEMPFDLSVPIYDLHNRWVRVALRKQRTKKRAASAEKSAASERS